MEHIETDEMKDAVETVRKIFEAIKEQLLKLAEFLKEVLPFFCACANNTRLCRLANSKKKRVAKKNYNRLMNIAYGRRGHYEKTHHTATKL